MTTKRDEETAKAGAHRKEEEEPVKAVKKEKKARAKLVAICPAPLGLQITIPNEEDGSSTFEDVVCLGLQDDGLVRHVTKMDTVEGIEAAEKAEEELKAEIELQKQIREDQMKAAREAADKAEAEEKEAAEAAEKAAKEAEKADRAAAKS